MQTYVILMNWTEQGIKNVKDVPERIEMAAKALGAAGGTGLQLGTHLWASTMQ